MFRKLVCFLSTFLGFMISLSYADVSQGLMPIPRSISVSDGKFALGKDFTVTVNGNPNTRLYAAASRFLRRLDDRTGLFIRQGYVSADSQPDGSLVVEVDRPAQLVVGEDESYELNVSANGIRIKASTDFGAMHGLETLLQLLASDEVGYYFPAVEIEDSPRFVWRGLMIDSSRHFLPVGTIKRNLDGMAAVKMNVLHWHLTEDQGFRVESKTYPKLHEMGSDGNFYSQEQIRDVIRYAGERGIRVVPEFDIPGHATSWLVGHPELGSAEGPYTVERGWGIFEPALDPTNEDVYTMLESFLGEMADLFPDAYIHIGGDEVTGKNWDENERIQSFMRENDIADNHALQSYFNQRVLKILTDKGKQMIGWDEILQPGMPTNIVIHSWRGRDSMVEAAKKGYSSVLSNGYYIDLMQSAAFHYLNDPLPADIELTDTEKKRVLGGEATMWSEHVTPETVDSRIWPRTAAIAERLWSSRSVVDVDSMYRRMKIVAIQLEEHGLTHIKNRGMLMRRLTKGEDVEPLRVIADVVEPLEGYRRNSDLSYSQFSPYTLLPDIAIADAADARSFNDTVSRYLSQKETSDLSAIKKWLEKWKSNHETLISLAELSPAIREAIPLSENLSRLSAIAMEAIESGSVPNAAFELIAKAREPVARTELRPVDGIESLLKYISDQH